MPKLTVGAKMPDLTFCTPYANGCSLSQIARRVKGKTALVFLRYYGCTLCQYDIHLYKEGYEKIAATGGQTATPPAAAPRWLQFSQIGRAHV